MKQIELSIDVLGSLLKNPKNAAKQHFIAQCPACGKDEHFYINKITLMWDCKKCGEKGNGYQFLKLIDRLDLITFGTSIERNFTKRDLLEEQQEVIIPHLPKKKMPTGYSQIESNWYLEYRNISQDVLDHQEFGVATILQMWRDYLLIPVYQFEECKGYVGRIMKTKEQLQEAEEQGKKFVRYKNSYDTDFGSLLGGYDEIVQDKTKVVIVVEGFFDKYNIDTVLELYHQFEIKCVCSFGKKLSAEQIQLLKLKEIDKVILFYDIDAVEDIKKYSYELLLNGFETYIVTTTGKKDPGEMKEEELLDTLNNLQKPLEFYTRTVSKRIKL